jgi:hypothetical protein
MPIRYFKATDGVFTVFRESQSRVYTHANFDTNGTVVRHISFSDEGGNFFAVEIDKAEYDRLADLKVSRSRLQGRNPQWDGHPSNSWVKNISF